MVDYHEKVERGRAVVAEIEAAFLGERGRVVGGRGMRPSGGWPEVPMKRRGGLVEDRLQLVEARLEGCDQRVGVLLDRVHRLTGVVGEMVGLAESQAKVLDEVDELHSWRDGRLVDVEARWEKHAEPGQHDPFPLPLPERAPLVSQPLVVEGLVESAEEAIARVEMGRSRQLELEEPPAPKPEPKPEPRKGPRRVPGAKVGMLKIPQGRVLMTVAEVSKLLGMPRKTLYQMARRGDLPALRVGKAALRIDAGELAEWMSGGGYKAWRYMPDGENPYRLLLKRVFPEELLEKAAE